MRLSAWHDKIVPNTHFGGALHVGRGLQTEVSTVESVHAELRSNIRTPPCLLKRRQHRRGEVVDLRGNEQQQAADGGLFGSASE